MCLRRFVANSDFMRCSTRRTGTACNNLLDHLVGERDYRWRHVKAERLGGLEIDEQLELSGLMYRKIDWPRSRKGDLCDFCNAPDFF